jgi:hypothetical protein
MADGLPRGHRGSGIFVTRGDFRVREIGFTLTDDDVLPESVTVAIRTDTFGHWVTVAREAVDRAETAREIAIEVAGHDAFRAAIESEFRASLTAVSAAASALDAFYVSVVHRAPEARIRARRRAGTLTETFKRAFALSHAETVAMQQPMRDVFRLRRHAVDPPQAFAPPVAHPVFGLGMDQRLVMFRVEPARAATSFAHRLIWLCLHRARRHETELRAWTDGARKHVDIPTVRPAPHADHAAWLRG